jgi:hypothetical protein
VHRRRRFTHVLAIAVAVLLAAAVAAPAQQAANPRVRQDLRSPDARDIAEGRPSPAEIVTLIRLVPDRRVAASEPSGFDLRDAAVGAAAATGLILLVAGTVMTLRRRYRDRPYDIVIQRSL